MPHPHRAASPYPRVAALEPAHPYSAPYTVGLRSTTDTNNGTPECAAFSAPEAMPLSKEGHDLQQRPAARGALIYSDAPEQGGP